MNKLLTYAGTQPIYLGDINFMQDAASDMFKSLAKALMNMPSDTMNAILQGVIITYPSAVTIAWSAGIVVLNGEILPVPAGTLTGGVDDTLYFHVNSVLSGSRTFKNLEEHDCYDTRTAYLSLTSTGGVPFINAPRLHGGNEDRGYSPLNMIAPLESAFLKAKNGFFFFEGSFTSSGVDASTGTLGSVQFSIFPVSDRSLTTKQYFTSLIYVLASDSTAIVLPVRLQITIAHVGVEADVLTITIFTPARAAAIGAGSGSFFFLLPIF